MSVANVTLRYESNHSRRETGTAHVLEVQASPRSQLEQVRAFLLLDLLGITIKIAYDIARPYLFDPKAKTLILRADLTPTESWVIATTVLPDAVTAVATEPPPLSR